MLHNIDVIYSCVTTNKQLDVSSAIGKIKNQQLVLQLILSESIAKERKLFKVCYLKMKPHFHCQQNPNPRYQTDKIY